MEGTPFQKLVWDALRTIPYGETRSYKQIATQIGHPNAMRAVGGACNKNPLPIVVPCHRVVGNDGKLVGFYGGVDLKDRLLQIEKDALAKPLHLIPDSENTILAELRELSDETYKAFISKLVPGITHIIGVRSPKLGKYARELAKGDFRALLRNIQSKYYEERLIEALVIGKAKMEFLERLSYAEAFIPKIDNWAVCDTFCSALQVPEAEKPLFWEFIQRYLMSTAEYDIRFGVVSIICNFMSSEYIDASFRAFDQIKHDGYYVKMAIAWAVSIFFIKFPDATMAYLKDNHLDKATYNKALQKIVESFRVDEETKAVIRSMRRKI